MKQYELELRNRLSGMVNRCYNQKDPSYKNYGAKGVTICKEWLDSPIAFVKWAIGNGYNKSLVIDKDILCDKLEIYPKVYSPGTCVWITPQENSKYVNSLRVYPPVLQYSKDGCLIKEFPSCTEAGKILNITPSNINRVCNGIRSTAGGFQWKFKEALKEVTKYEAPNRCKEVHIQQLDKNSKEVLNEFLSYKEAGLSVNKTNTSPIRAMCTNSTLPSGNLRTSAYGYIWQIKPKEKTF